MPKVKICCISSVEEAEIAVAHGAAALGLVSAMPSGPGPISEELIAEIVRHIPAGIASFLLTSRQDAAGIIAQQKKTNATTLQLVDSVSADVYRSIRSELPGVKIVQVIHVTGPESVEEALAVAPFIDMVLLDSGNPTLAVKELGGTGRTHNWEISAEIVRTVQRPVFLAGGLHSGNVRQAVEQVKPYGVDLCSSLRTGGTLDRSKVEDFFAAIRSIGT